MNITDTFSKEFFSHHEGQIKKPPSEGQIKKPPSEHIPSPKYLEGEKSSSASPTPQTISTEADTDMSHGKKIVDGQGCTPSPMVPGTLSNPCSSLSSRPGMLPSIARLTIHQSRSTVPSGEVLPLSKECLCQKPR